MTKLVPTTVPLNVASFINACPCKAIGSANARQPTAEVKSAGQNFPAIIVLVVLIKAETFPSLIAMLLCVKSNYGFLLRLCSSRYPRLSNDRPLHAWNGNRLLFLNRVKRPCGGATCLRPPRIRCGYLPSPAPGLIALVACSAGVSSLTSCRHKPYRPPGGLTSNFTPFQPGLKFAE